jgi:uncharacterized protein (UPF0335 family)
MKTKTVTRQLYVQLTDSELTEKGEELATITRRIRELEDEKKSIVKTMGEAIKEQQGTANYVADVIKSGAQLRPVKCAVAASGVEPGKAVVTRLDTHEVVEVRPMTDEERQEELEFGSEPEAAEPTIGDDEPEPDEVTQ